MTNNITIDEWQQYIDYKKKLIIENINNTDDLDNSKDNIKFITILKSIINLKIFNISKFSYSAINLLIISSFINPVILYNIIKDDKITKNFEGTYTESNLDTNINTNINTNTTLTNILKIIIDFLVQIEISLNYHCILIIHFINKLQQQVHTQQQLQQQPHPQVFNSFSKIDKTITESIKPSTLILLFIKFLQKLGGGQKYNIFNKLLLFEKTNKSVITKKQNIKELLQTNTNMKASLDTFIININKYFINTSKKIDTPDTILNNNIYSICTNYIISIVELFYNNFNILFSILEHYILLNITETMKDTNNLLEYENKKQELETIKISIKQLINDEIKLCKEVFRI